jgi:DNA-binding response OmpR family regulator
MASRLLLVEDDDAVADAVGLHLLQAGFALDREADGARALRRIERDEFDLVLLDLTLPGADGWDITRHLRERRPQTPVMILSARSAEAHRVLGLELGADDYLVKPFSMLEMLARVRALLRRSALRATAPPAALAVGRWRLDPQRRTLDDGASVLALTLREFDLLHFLAQHPGQVFNRGQLLDRVWGAGFDGYEHTVNSHINRLRQKVEADPMRPKLIQTVWGIGYRFEPAARA